MSPLSYRSPDDPSPGGLAVRKKLIVQALVATPGIIFVLIAMRGAFTDYHYMHNVRRRAEARTAQTVGMIIEVHDRVSGKGRVIPQGAGTMGFTTESGREVQVRFRLFSGQPGSKMTVRYDPNDPENCTMGAELFGWSDLFWGNVPFLILSLMFLVPAIVIGRSNE